MCRMHYVHMDGKKNENCHFCGGGTITSAITRIVTCELLFYYFLLWLECPQLCARARKSTLHAICLMSYHEIREMPNDSDRSTSSECRIVFNFFPDNAVSFVRRNSFQFSECANRDARMYQIAGQMPFDDFLNCFLGGRYSRWRHYLLKFLPCST